MSSHDLKEIEFHPGNVRPDSHEFERKLRCAVPSILRLGEDCEELIEYGAGLESYSFQLQQVDRKKGYWLLTYGAWEDHGSGRQVAEIRVRIGKTYALDESFGVAAFICCFAPAIRIEKPLRGKLKDSARLIIKADDSEKSWEIPDGKPALRTLKLVGSDPVPSQRARIGLNDDAANALKSHKVMKSFLPNVPSRNPLTHYHKLWKTWCVMIRMCKSGILLIFVFFLFLCNANIHLVFYK